jgi:hypothetical protein
MMNMMTRVPGLSLACALAVGSAAGGCGGESPYGSAIDTDAPPPAAPGPAADAGAPPGVPGCAYEPASGSTYPPGPYGKTGAVGERFESFELEDCDGRRVRFGDVAASGEVTLLSVGAGWCVPCIEESKVLEATVHSPLCGRGLRVIQVLFQDEDSRPASKLFCRQWRERFGLKFPVLVDPLFITQRYLGASPTPLNLAIDKTARVRMRTTGAIPHDFAARLEALLPR